MNFLTVIFLLITTGFCLNNNIPHDESEIDQESFWWSGLYDKTYAMPFSGENSSRTIQENETNLGLIIAECYLDPLCFKLEVP
jgi:hypothetical protein